MQSIFDVWHYAVIWTYELTRILWYTCKFMQWILFITLHTTNMKQAARCTSLHTPMFILQYTTKCTWLNIPSPHDCTLPIALDGILTACLMYTLKHGLERLTKTVWTCSQVYIRVCFQVHSQAYSLEHSQLHPIMHSQPAWLLTPK